MTTRKTLAPPATGALSLALLLACAGPGAADDPFARFELPGGVRLAVLHVPDAPRQTTFSFLPAGLVTDPAGRAQLSHLAEHLLIRSTDPDSLAPEGMQLNGETTAGALRVETYAEPEAWRASLERHARWLLGTELGSLDGEVLAREKERIAGEERTTTAGGFTHKWAEAAWGQVVRGGRSHAAVHGDVADATLDDVRAWMEAHLRAGPAVLVASVGPIEPERVRAALAQSLGAAPRTARDGAARPAAAERGDGAARDRATWDLDAVQYLEWYPLPGEDADRVAGVALSQIVNAELARRGAEDAQVFGPGRALARVVVAPEGAVLLLSAALPDADARGAAAELFSAALEGAAEGAGMSLESALFQLRAAAGRLPDPAAARAQLRRLGRDASLVEAQLVLNALLPEVRLGLDRAALLEAWSEVDAERVAALVEGALGPEHRRSLLLTPAD